MLLIMFTCQTHWESAALSETTHLSSATEPGLTSVYSGTVEKYWAVCTECMMMARSVLIMASCRVMFWPGWSLPDCSDL